MASFVDITQNLNIQPDDPKESLPVTTGEFLEAKFQQSINDTTTGSLARVVNNFKFKYDKNEAIYTGEEISKMHPGSEVARNMKSFSTMRQSQLDLLLEREEERNRLQSVIDRGNDDFTTQALGFGASAVPFIFDPVDALLTLGMGKYVNAALGVKAATTFAGKTARDIGEALAVNLTTEALVVQPVKSIEQQDLSFTDAIVNTSIASIGFPLVTGLAAKGLSKFAGLFPSQAAKADAMTGMISAAEAKIEADLRPDVSDVIDVTLRRKLPEMEKSLDEVNTKLKETPDDVELVARKAELEEVITETKNLPEVDDATLRQQSNSVENELYYDKKALDDFDKAEAPSDEVKLIQENYDLDLEKASGMEKLEELDADSKLLFEEAKTIKSKIPVIDELYKASTFCLKP